MSEQLYKVCLRHDGYMWWTDADRYWRLRWPFIQGQLNRYGWRGYVRRYVTYDNQKRTSEMVIVLNDRNTAILLKLALA